MVSGGGGGRAFSARRVNLGPTIAHVAFAISPSGSPPTKLKLGTRPCSMQRDVMPRSVCPHGVKGCLGGDVRSMAGIPQTVCPSLEEATHPRCWGEGSPDWPGRASSKEGESWVIITARSLESIRRSCAMPLRSRRRVVAGAVAFSAKSTPPQPRRANPSPTLPRKNRQQKFADVTSSRGYGLYRLIRKLGHDCIVVAPSLIPKKPGDRVKTNRRDAMGLAKLSRAGELTAVWVPDERHEAMRDLSRAREAAQKDLQGKRQQVSSFMLRLGRHYPGKKTWGRAHMNWLMQQKLEQREQRIALEEFLGAVRQ